MRQRLLALFETHFEPARQEEPELQWLHTPQSREGIGAMGPRELDGGACFARVRRHALARRHAVVMATCSHCEDGAYTQRSVGCRALARTRELPGQGLPLSALRALFAPAHVRLAARTPVG